MWFQRNIEIPPYPRGIHLITDLVVDKCPELTQIDVGLAHFQLLHTSAGLTLNENADPLVRTDMERHLRHLVPDGDRNFEHVAEGPDDMPAHFKASLFGSNLVLPVRSGRLALGTWQGIYFCEFREGAPGRSLLATLLGGSGQQ